MNKIVKCINSRLFSKRIPVNCFKRNNEENTNIINRRINTAFPQISKWKIDVFNCQKI